MKKEWSVQNKNPNGKNIIHDILVKRGIKDIQHFLNPVPSDLIPLNKLSNMVETVELIDQGIKENKRFTIFYDAADSDGICAGTMMRKYLGHFTKNVGYVFAVGKKHGLQHIDLDEVIKVTDILIIVDSSTGDHEQQNYLKEHGVTVIVADHHDEPNNPNVCIINSQFNYPNPQLSGSGVTWKLCMALDNAFGTKYALDYLDLAAIGILADVSSVGEDYMENRLIVHMGLRHLKNVAIGIILGAYEFNSTSVLFSIAPLINASARMSQNQMVIDFLMEEDRTIAKDYFEDLKEVKEQQKILVDIESRKLEGQIEKQDYINNKVIHGFVEGGSFAGLIATKMCEKYGRPAIVLHNPKEGDIEHAGSMRATGVKDFKSMINDTKLAESKGHKSAAGVFIPFENLNPLLLKLNEVLKDIEFKTEEEIDIQLEPEEVTIELIKEMEKINRLTGKDFKPITVFIEGIESKNVDSMKSGRHSKFEANGIEFIKWNSKLYEELKYSTGIYTKLDVFGTLSKSTFRGKTKKQLIINDTRNIEKLLEFFR